MVWRFERLLALLALVMGLGSFAALFMIALTGPGLTGWIRRWTEPVDEWILSLGEEDLAVLSHGRTDDMFWSWYRLMPLHPAYLSKLMDSDLWTRCRFSYRHRVSGRKVSSFLSGGLPGPVATDDGLQVLMRWFS